MHTSVLSSNNTWAVGEMLVIKALAPRARAFITAHLNSCPCIIGRSNTRMPLLFLKYWFVLESNISFTVFIPFENQPL